MCDVIDIYRNAGFQIIHVPDNFRIGDKGGLNFIHNVLKKRDWLSKGDKVFNWNIYSDCDDLNTIAMNHGLDEIDAQSIIANSWGEDEVRANYDKHFYEWLEVLREKIGQEKWEKIVAGFGISSKEIDDAYYKGDDEEDGIPDRWQEKDEMITAIFGNNSNSPQTSQESVIVSKDENPIASAQDDDLDDCFAELEAEQQQSIAEAKERELMKNRYEKHLEEEMWELNRTMKSAFSSKTCA